MTANYHERFNNLHDTAVEHVRHRSSPVWNADTEDEAFDLMRALAADLAATYGIPAPSVRRDDREVYYRADAAIGLPRPSIVSLLHEFRHHMQAHGMQANEDVEEDARGWSISMFAEARPASFDKAWRRGTIMFMAEHPGR